MASTHSSEPGRTILVTNPGAELYGADRVALETISALVEAGARVVVALGDDGPLSKHIEERGGRAVIVPTAVLRKSALRPMGLLGLAKDAITRIAPAVRLIRRERPDAVIVNTIVSPLWLIAAKLTRTPVISHVHEAETAGSGLVRRALALPQLLADKLIVNSEFSRDVLVSCWHRLAGHSTVIYNAVPGPKKVTAPRKDLSGPIRLLYVGRLSPRKGPDVAVSAVSALVERGVNVELDLVGAVFSGYEWFEKQLREQVDTMGLQDRVHFHGFCDNIWPFTERADISIVPSTADEPFGNTAVEAALSGRPLIVSATSGLLEASRCLSSCIGVERCSPKAIADAVVTMVDHWAEFADRATHDAGIAAERYSAHRYASEMVSVVNAVVDPRSTTQPSPGSTSTPHHPST